MKKIFILAGELSGDNLAAWYVKKLKQQGEPLFIAGVGGDAMAAEGVELVERFEKLNIVGIAEILSSLPKIFRYLRWFTQYIIDNHFDSVVVVDFPGFNLRLIKRLKKACPTLHITYLSPPQLWCWGAWRVKTIRRCVDNVIVLYPFEVAWYQARGVCAQWLGYPLYESVRVHYKPYAERKPLIAIIPGSRHSEIKQLLPIFLRAAAIIKRKNPSVHFMLPLASSLSIELIRTVAKKHGLESVLSYTDIIQASENHYNQLSYCCAAISKPGTVTLELALLGIPTVVGFKTSWLTYHIARLVITVSAMSLPNLLTGKTVFEEFIQKRCTQANIALAVEAIVHEFTSMPRLYEALLRSIDDVADKVAPC